MKLRLSAPQLAVAGYFLVLPAVGVGGALPIAVTIVLATLAAFRPSLVRQVLENRPWPVVLLLAVTLWAMISTLWSPLPWDDQVAKLAVLIPAGVMFAASANADAQTQRMTRAAALAAVIVLIPLLAIEAIWELPLNRAALPNEPVDQLNFNVARGATLLLALMWGAAGVLAVRGGALSMIGAALIAAATGILCFQFGQLSNAVALGFGLAALVFGFLAPRIALLTLSGGLAAWMLLAPFLTPLLLSSSKLVEAMPLSWAQRAGIWRYVSARIMEQPLFGHGLEASRTVDERVDVRGLQMEALPLHPHSASMHIWYETGAVGALLMAAAIFTGGLWLARSFAGHRVAAAAASATLASMGLVWNVSFGVWAEWWIAALFTAAAVVGALRPVARA